jgi:hypothetical protein
LLSCLEKYPTRILLSFVAAALIVVPAACNRSETPDPLTRELSEDEWYLIEAYAGIKHARSFYSSNPEYAESLFTVLDSTIDSDRIANTIRDTNEYPERWEKIFEQLERTMRESASKVESEKIRSEKPGG